MPQKCIKEAFEIGLIHHIQRWTGLYVTAIFQQCVYLCGQHHLTSSVKPAEEGEVEEDEEDGAKLICNACA